MYSWTITFEGRKVGAIGTFYNVTLHHVQLKADNCKDAREEFLNSNYYRHWELNNIVSVAMETQVPV